MELTKAVGSVYIDTVIRKEVCWQCIGMHHRRIIRTCRVVWCDDVEPMFYLLCIDDTIDYCCCYHRCGSCRRCCRSRSHDGRCYCHYRYVGLLLLLLLFLLSLLMLY